MFKETKTFPSQRTPPQHLVSTVEPSEADMENWCWRAKLQGRSCVVEGRPWTQREGGSQLGAALRQAQHVEDKSAETRLPRRARHGVGSRPAQQS